MHRSNAISASPLHDLLSSWALRHGKTVPRQFRQIVTTTRFAFYGRMSTKDRQHLASSMNWQYHYAGSLTAGHGQIVASFFDAGYSRRIDWHQRPQAAALLAALSDPDRGFDAIVIGEFERGFYGSQLRQLIPLFQQHGIQVWLPEIGGPIDPDDPQQMALLGLLSVESTWEVSRAQYRTTAAMRLHARDGRLLGGRPPYGYRRVDAGPHPNPEHARWGRRSFRLEADPATAPHVRWMFAQRLAGHSPAAIAQQLTQQNVPNPSAADPIRNPHRSGDRWSPRTVACMLANPRYTGRQVWNRRPSHIHHTPERIHQPGVTEWIIAPGVAHTALVSEQDFIAVQTVRSNPRPDDGSTRTYVLAGIVFCGTCGRGMQAHWANGRHHAYRCRHGHRRTAGVAKALYIRQDHLLHRLQHLASRTPSLELNLDHQHDLAGQFRERQIVIVCTTDTWRLETPDRDYPLPPAHQQEPLISETVAPTPIPTGWNERAERTSPKARTQKEQQNRHLRPSPGRPPN